MKSCYYWLIHICLVSRLSIIILHESQHPKVYFYFEMLIFDIDSFLWVSATSGNWVTNINLYRALYSKRPLSLCKKSASPVEG